MRENDFRNFITNTFTVWIHYSLAPRTNNSHTHIYHIHMMDHNKAS